MTEVPSRQKPRGPSDCESGYTLLGHMYSESKSKRWLAVVEALIGQVRIGVSAAELIRAASERRPAELGRYPCDWDDLERCEIVHALVPEWAADLMRTDLSAYRWYVKVNMARSDPHQAPHFPQFWSPRLPREG